MMKNVVVISLALAVAAVSLQEAAGGSMRGPITGQKVQMRGPVRGQRAQMRGPVRGRRAETKKPVWSGAGRTNWYNQNSFSAYTSTGTNIYRGNSRNFNGFQGNWNPETQWKDGRYRARVHNNIYRVNR